MNNLIKALIKPVRALIVASVVLSSCESDLWKDHYSYKSDSGKPVTTLGNTIEGMGKDGNKDAYYFYETLKNTYIYENNKKTLVRYSDLLTDDQFFTIWLPTGISEVEWQKYAKKNKTDEENLEVGRDFILNHVARFSHSVGTKSYDQIKMMNDKSYTADGQKSFHAVGYKESKVNIRCTNGLLHILNGYIPYSPNIYDYLTGNTVYKSAIGEEYRYDTLFGKWFAGFTVETIDKNKSVEGEINMETGEKEWIDKVVIRSSEMMNKYGFIDVEDSMYAVVLPTPALWKTMYDSLGNYYVYSDDETYGDSLHRFWTNSCLITDAFFNIKVQKKKAKDSVTSTLFSKVERMTEKYPYHVFYKPYDAGGLFADRVDSVVCSNGIIYIRDSWPYSDKVFRRTVKLEAEDVVYSGDFSKASPRNIRYTENGVSKTARVMMLDKKGAFEPDFEIPDNLKGEYYIKIVFFPKSGTSKPGTQVHPVVSYVVGDNYEVLVDEKVKKNRRTVDKVYDIATDISKPDTLTLGPVVLPDCNYKTKSPKLKVTIKSAVENENVFSKEMWIDCLMLDPVFQL